MVKRKVLQWCTGERGLWRTLVPSLQGVAGSPQAEGSQVQVPVRNTLSPTWHRGNASDWFAGIRTRSSCCGSSSALVGHGFWPQIERNLGMETKMASLVLCLQQVRNITHSRQPLSLLLVPLPRNRGMHNARWVEYRTFTFMLFICRHSQEGKNKSVTSPKANLKTYHHQIPTIEKSMGGGGHFPTERLEN